MVARYVSILKINNKRTNCRAYFFISVYNVWLILIISVGICSKTCFWPIILTMGTNDLINIFGTIPVTSPCQ